MFIPGEWFAHLRQSAHGCHQCRAGVGALARCQGMPRLLHRRDRVGGFGASPRGTISLDLCSRAHAWLKGKDFVSPEDIHEVFHDVLRHRVLLSFEAEAAGVDADSVLDKILELVPSA